jgi:hypothetical protein
METTKLEKLARLSGKATSRSRFKEGQKLAEEMGSAEGRLSQRSLHSRIECGEKP